MSNIDANTADAICRFTVAEDKWVRLDARLTELEWEGRKDILKPEFYVTRTRLRTEAKDAADALRDVANKHPDPAVRRHILVGVLGKNGL